MRILTQKQIKRAISNVNASLAIEGLKTSRTTMIHGQKILQGEIDIDDAIKITTKKILAKKRQLLKA